MPYQGTANFKYTQELPTVTPREAVKVRKGGTKCNCTGSCKRGRCSCTHVGFECSSFCHLKNSSCLDKDNSEVNDDKCTITKVENSSSVSSLSKRRKNQVEVQCKLKHRKVASGVSVDDEEKRIIKEGGWLNDKHIEAANILLRKQFPSVVGLQSRVLGQTFAFDICQRPFIQILNVQGNHWCTVARISSSDVHVYDSLLQCLPEDAKLQIAAILCSKAASIECKLH